ncbi:MAG: hypothetical protein A2V70_09950 [Planctomycetes bacterium RBG_13_63_9]|nr:MAG: hypothetical protein A2V70_09950 [Planctomycetes bacterium RBG_13_63_9]
MMDINRNQYFLIGLVLLLLGIQIYLVDSYVLTPECTRILAERTGHPLAAANSAAPALIQSDDLNIKKTVIPPEWLGWAVMSIGSVLVLHAMGMKKPD